MANPTEPFSPEEIAEAVEQARSCWGDKGSRLTQKYRDSMIGHWVPFLLARIDELEKSRCDAEAVKVELDKHQNLPDSIPLSVRIRMLVDRMKAEAGEVR